MVKQETEAQMRARWQTESDADALKRVAEIQADPKRLKNAHGHIKKQVDSLQSALPVIKKPATRSSRKK